MNGKKQGDSRDEDALLTARLHDAMRLAEKRGYTVCTDFLSPAQQITAQKVARQAPQGICFALWGGYATAERKRGAFFPDWITEPDFDLAAAELNTRGEYPEHSEILGALTGLGVRREKVGDILADIVPPKIICSAELLPFLTENFTKAGRKAFRTTVSSLSPDEIPEPDREEKTFTVPSLRLDCVAGEGFGISRTKAAEKIRAGAASVNWQEELSPSAEVKQGDMISLRGNGRFQIYSIGGVSRKGRIFVTIKR